MSQDYVISKGTNLRFSREKSVDPVLLTQIEEYFARHDCLKSFSILSVQRGWFSRKISTLLVVHDNAEAYRQAYADLAKTLTAYFTRNPGFMDCMSFDWSNTDHRHFVESLMARMPFAKKEPN